MALNCCDQRGNGVELEGLEALRNCFDESGDATEKKSLEPKCDGDAMIRAERLRHSPEEYGGAWQRKGSERLGRAAEGLSGASRRRAKERRSTAQEMNGIDIHGSKNPRSCWNRNGDRNLNHNEKALFCIIQQTGPENKEEL